MNSWIWPASDLLTHTCQVEEGLPTRVYQEFPHRVPPTITGDPFIVEDDGELRRKNNVRERFPWIGCFRRVPDVLHLMMRLCGWWCCILEYIAIAGGVKGKLHYMLKKYASIKPPNIVKDKGYWKLDEKQSKLLLSGSNHLYQNERWWSRVLYQSGRSITIP